MDITRRVRSAGHTLIELLVALLIAALLAAQALPALAGLVQRQRLGADAQQLLRVLLLARTQALAHDQPTVACTSRSGQSCDADSAGWHEGLLVFIDHDGNSAFGAGDTLLYHRAPFSLHSHITGNSGVQRWVRFGADGRPVANGTLSLIGDDGQAAARDVVISSSGRIRVTR